MSKMTTHINPETGEHGKCTATVKDCPYQKQGNKLGIETHFKTIKEAKVAGETIKENIYGSFASVNKKTNGNKTNKQPAFEIENRQKFMQLIEKNLSKEQMAKMVEFLEQDSKEFQVILKYDNPTYFIKLLSQPNMDEFSMKKLIKIYGIDDVMLRNGPFSEAAYLALSKSKLNSDQSRMLAQSEYVKGEVLEILSKKISNNNIGYLIDNPNLTVELANKMVQERLVTNPKKYGGNQHWVINCLKRKNLLSGESIELALTNLKEDVWSWSVESMASLPNCPKYLQKEYDEVKKFRQMAEDKNTTAADLDFIISDEFAEKYPEAANGEWREFRMAKSQAICHPNLGDGAIKKLITTANQNQLWSMSRTQKIKTKEAFDEIYNDLQNNKDRNTQRDIKVYAMLARSNNANAEQLTKIANICSQYKENNDNNNGVEEITLQAVAGNKNAAPQLLKKLASHRLLSVKTEAASNPNTPAASLERLATLFQPQLFDPLMENPKLPVKAQMNLLKNSDFIRDPYRATDNVLNLLKNPNVDVTVLDYLADNITEDTYDNYNVYKQKVIDKTKILDAVRKHPKTSMKTLLKLGNQTVDDKGDDNE